MDPERIPAKTNWRKLAAWKLAVGKDTRVDEKSGGIFEITCECCGAKIHVDPQTKKIFFTEKKGMKKRTFEEVVKDVTSVGERAEEKFKKNVEKEKNQKEKLERLFEEGKIKAMKEPNKRPPSIWDYD